MNDFQKYIKLLHEIAIVNIENGTPNNVKNEVRALQIRYNIRGNLQKIALEILREETQKLQLEFVKEMYSPIGNMASKSLLKIEKTMPDKIVDLVSKEKMNGSEDATILRKLKKNLRVEKGRLKTVQNTVSMGLSRSQTFIDAGKAGVQKLRYEGRKGGNIRPFCSEHVGKIYTLEEVKNLDNGQGLDVLYFCGGYNCTHRWVAMF